LKTGTPTAKGTELSHLAMSCGNLNDVNDDNFGNCSAGHIQIVGSFIGQFLGASS
jgi:hypothetical protein